MAVTLLHHNFGKFPELPKAESLYIIKVSILFTLSRTGEYNTSESEIGEKNGSLKS